MTDTQTQASTTTQLDLSGALEWRCAGPHRGGRVVAVAGHPEDPKTFYFGACAGGIWKSNDGGTYWENCSDGYLTTAAIGALAIAPSDPNVLYAGTGETTIRSNVSHGDGVYRSTDGGKSWRNVGLTETRHIARIRIHPQDPKVVYVAALGHAWGPNPERGIYRSTDGGENWKQILFRDEHSGAIDLSLDPHNPRILYAAFWDAHRTPYSLVSGGPGSGLFKSTDGGDTWTELTRNEGLPQGVIGKIGVAVSPAKPDRVWAIVEAEDGAFFRSDDGGQTWQRVCEDGDLRRRAWYYLHIFADPQDAETVWILNLQAWKSVDGGKTFSSVPTPHGDNHDLWIDPQNPLRMIEGNDGGACVSFNGGDSWSTIYNQPTAQFYHVTTDNQVPYRLYGSQQDNTAITIPSMSTTGAISETEWFVPGGGESGYIAVRPDNPDIVFGGAIGSGAFNGRLTRYDRKTGQQRNITVWPEDHSMGEGAETLKYRFQWTFPIALSPHDPNVLYTAANRLFRSTDEGESWEAISPDLTRADPNTLKASGGPITKDNTGAEVYGTIFAFVESPHEKGVFWTGSDDGLVQISRDGGANWEDVTPPDLQPQGGTGPLISIIEVSPHDAATAYVAATGYKTQDNRPYLFKTNDYGKTWQKITNGIPEDDFTRVIREDPARKGLLYAGTETRVYVSFDDGGTWQHLNSNLPIVPIHDLAVKGDALVAATHGRSFWILDDLGPIRQAAGQFDPGSVQLFAPSVTTRFKIRAGWSYEPGPYVTYRRVGPLVVGFRSKPKPDGTQGEHFLDAGKNPPNGVVVSYFLPQAPKDDITLTFLDGNGKEIRTFTSKPKPEAVAAAESDTVTEEVIATGAEGLEGEPEAAMEVEAAKQDKEQKVPKEAGGNRFVWNMRYPDPTHLPGDKTLEDAPPGPVAVPGKYEVRLTVDGQTYTQPFEIVADPRISATQQDLQEQFDLLTKIEQELSEVHDAVLQIRDLRPQLEVWEKRLSGPQGNQGLAQQAKELVKRLNEIESSMANLKTDSPLSFPDKVNFKLANLIDAVDSADFKPTKQEYEVFHKLSQEADADLQQFQEVVSTDLDRFNSAIRDASLPAVGPSTRSQQQETREPATVSEESGRGVEVS